MSYIVSITSQGQISIPAKIRRELGLEKYKKAYVSKQGNTMVVEPITDVLSLAGSLKKYGIKNKSIDEIMKLEKEAVARAVVERYKRKLKRSGINTIEI